MRHDDETAFLRALSPEGLEALTGLGRRQRYPKGAPLFVEGEQSDPVLCILDGRVKVSLVTAPSPRRSWRDGRARRGRR
jgi:CRP-like cAMP-binding protein